MKPLNCYVGIFGQHRYRACRLVNVFDQVCSIKTAVEMLDLFVQMVSITNHFSAKYFPQKCFIQNSCPI